MNNKPKSLADIQIKTTIGNNETENIVDMAINRLDKFGVCIVSSFLDSSKITALNLEFSRIFDQKVKKGISIHPHINNKKGKVARCKIDHLDSQNEIKKTFHSSFMKQLSKEYFQTSFELNDDIFLTHEKECNNDILPWHFDRQQSLKFYINLLDVNEENGAFNYDLGSHREGHFRANYYILSGVEVGKIPNDIPEDELHNPVVIEAKAGDLIIFDPDGFHKAGTIAEGKERKVIRGHSHPLPNRTYKARPFKAHWWLQTPLNLAKILRKKGSRNIIPSRLTNATRNR